MGEEGWERGYRLSDIAGTTQCLCSPSVDMIC